MGAGIAVDNPPPACFAARAARWTDVNGRRAPGTHLTRLA